VSYPEAAPRLRSGDSVSVGVVFVVNEGGEVTELRVVESGGKVLDEAVTAGVRSWKYAPAVKKGTKVKVQIAFKQTFRAGEPMAKLVVNPTSSNRGEISLSRSTLLAIGRDPSSGLVLPAAMVSRRHAVIEWRGTQFFVRDCNSSNGSVV